MKTFNISAIRSLSVNEMFRTPPEPPKDILCKFQYNTDELTAMSDSLTLILNRDIRSSMEHASSMAVFLAKKFPERKTLLINTYAGAKFMQETIMKGIIDSRIAMPSEWKYAGGVPETAEFSDEAADGFLPNLRLMNCPVSTLDARRLEAEVTKHGYSIVILNSFEFSSLTHYSLSLLARGIIELREKQKLAMVIYSQQFRAGISASFIGRGPIGMMAPYSDSIWRVYSDFASVHISKKNMEKINELNPEELNAVH